MKAKRQKLNGVFYSTKQAELLDTYIHTGLYKTQDYKKITYKCKKTGQLFIHMEDVMGSHLILTTERDFAAHLARTNTLF